MKWNPFLAKLLLVAVLPAWAAPATAASRYTDKTTALELAETLDKGAFRDRLIISTFIQSVGKGRYLIKVVLENGAELNWDLNKVRSLTKAEQIVLRNNGALLFPSEEDNRFVTLDKTLFSRIALRSKVFVKYYPNSDVLAGQKLNFGIHRFNLVKLLNVRPGRDEQGYPHHYIIDLENGQRELLSYLDAYFALTREALVEDPSTVSSVIRAPYRIEGIEPIPLQPDGDTGTGKFGFEIIFDRPVALEPGHFPFRFIENGNGHGGRRNRPDFLVEITSPNSELREAISPIDTIEFLRHVHVAPASGHGVRLVLRAGISPEVMNFPPEVKVQGSRVLISFTKVVDQTVFDQQARAEQTLRTRQDRLLHRELSPEEVQQRKDYKSLMVEGDTRRNRARRTTPFSAKYEMLSAAMDAFRQAASNASTDSELQQALRERNTILARLPTMVVRHARQAVRGKAGVQRAELRNLLDKAALLTRDRQMLRAIKKLIDHPSLR